MNKQEIQQLLKIREKELNEQDNDELLGEEYMGEARAAEIQDRLNALEQQLEDMEDDDLFGDWLDEQRQERISKELEEYEQELYQE